MENYLYFVFMSILLIILPGPDTALITKNSISKGKIAGIHTVFGTLVALLIHTLATVMGLSTLIVKSALFFSILKYVGSIYLIYLGCKSIIHILKNHQLSVGKENNKRSKFEDKSYFIQGFLSNILNPKVAVFFLTFLPQFSESINNAFVEFLALGLSYTVLTMVWSIFYVYLINYISEFMKKPTTLKTVEGITGGVLILFGIKLVLDNK